MALPNSLVIGPMKSGTTWLAGYLEERGDVCLPAGVKETFFFDRNYDSGLDWYRAHFEHYDPQRHRAIVEVGSSYFHSAAAPERIRKDLGDIKLVAILRDPVLRAWSHYCHLLRYGYTRLPLREAAVEFPAILDASRYHGTLEVWSRHFPSQPVRLLSFDLLKSDELGFCRAACESLGLDFRAPVPGASRDKYAAARPTSLWLARTSRNIAASFKQRRLYSVVNFAKRLGLKRLAFGSSSDSPMPQPTAEDLLWLKNELAPDIVKLRSLVDIGSNPWLATYA